MIAQKPLVMIIDDEIRMRQLIKELLEMAGYRVITDSDGREALSVLREVKPDLILIEALMPAVDGYTLCHRIRELCQAPFIIIVDGDINEGVRALDAGASDYLTKPFSHVELTTRVKATLSRSTLRNERPPADSCYDKLFPTRTMGDTYALTEGNRLSGLGYTPAGNAPYLSYNMN